MNVKAKGHEIKAKETVRKEPRDSSEKVQFLIIEINDKKINFPITHVDQSDFSQIVDFERVFVFEQDKVIGEALSDDYVHWLQYDIQKEKWTAGVDEKKEVYTGGDVGTTLWER